MIPARILKIRVIVDLITYLIGATALLAVAPQIRGFCTALSATLVLASLYFAYSRRIVMHRLALNLLSLAVIAVAVYRLDINELITQMLEALLILLGIKFLEEKRVRDYMQIYAISLLLVAGSGLISPGIVFLTYFSFTIFGLTMASILLSYYASDPDMELAAAVVGKIVRNALLIPVLAVPLTIAMFLILPRTNYPFIDFLNRRDRAQAGFSDQVRLGEVSSIQENGSVALRVNMDRVDEGHLYWRGVVLDYFDGAGWKSRDSGTVERPGDIFFEGKLVKQTIYLEPSDGKHLFALDKPVYVSLKRVVHQRDGTFISPAYPGGRIKYEARSAISGWIPEKEIDRRRYLQLPDRLSRRLLDLVHDLGRGRDESGKINQFYRFLHDGAFRYSLKNLPVTSRPIDTFLFETKYGNCEYFASAYAVMLRASGIPARLVGGYKGGYRNGMGNYYLVPEKNAHVWVEVFVEGKGWLRIDPTPASLESFVSLTEKNLFLRVRLFFDTVNYYWYAFVINYNLEKQLFFVRTVRTALQKTRFRLTMGAGAFGSAGYLKYVGILALAACLPLILSRVRLKRRSAEEEVLASFLKKMEKRGYTRKPSQGLEEFVSSVGEDGLRTEAERFVRTFETYFFRDTKIPEDEIRRLRLMVRHMAGRTRGIRSRRRNICGKRA